MTCEAEELSIKDWVGVLGTQIDELLNNEEGILGAICLCEEALIDSAPVMASIHDQIAWVEGVMLAYRALYETLSGEKLEKPRLLIRRT